MRQERVALRARDTFDAIYSLLTAEFPPNADQVSLGPSRNALLHGRCTAGAPSWATAGCNATPPPGGPRLRIAFSAYCTAYSLRQFFCHDRRDPRASSLLLPATLIATAPLRRSKPACTLGTGPTTPTYRWWPETQSAYRIRRPNGLCGCHASLLRAPEPIHHCTASCAPH